MKAGFWYLERMLEKCGDCIRYFRKKSVAGINNNRVTVYFPEDDEEETW
ncbi:MAG: hypothetical protein ACLR2O_04710 [Coprococcus sp.]